MNNFKKWFIEKLGLNLNKEIDKAIQTGREQERKQKQADSQTSKYKELENYCHHPVIIFNNEIDNPVIGFGKSIITSSSHSDPLLKVTDYVSGKDVICFGKVYHYNELLLKWYYESDPRLLLSLIYNRQFHSDDDIDQLLSKLHSYEEVLDILEQNGFFERLKDYD